MLAREYAKDSIPANGSCWVTFIRKFCVEVDGIRVHLVLYTYKSAVSSRWQDEMKCYPPTLCDNSCDATMVDLGTISPDLPKLVQALVDEQKEKT